MNTFFISLRLFFTLTLLLGFIYPILIYALGFLFFQEQASGNLVEYKNKIIGSKLIGQKFENDHYFLSRPSSSDYDALNSGGSNLSPTSLPLRNRVLERKNKINNNEKQIPSELLFSSGSSLDPHISKENAYFQIDRIIKARNLDPLKAKKIMEDLIEKLTNEYFFSKLGKPYLNLLTLNISLDVELEKMKKETSLEP